MRLRIPRDLSVPLRPCSPGAVGGAAPPRRAAARPLLPRPPRLSEGPARQPGGRLPRHAGRRPVPARSRTPTRPRRGPGSTRRTRSRARCSTPIPERARDPRAPRGALELRALLGPVPRRRRGLFYTRHDGLKNQPVLYVARPRTAATPRVLLDPNGLSKDGTVALSGLSVSRGREHGRARPRRRGLGLGGVARPWTSRRAPRPATACAGSSSRRRPSTRRQGPLLRPLRRARRRAASSTPSLKNQKVFFHRLGTPQAADTLVYSRPTTPNFLNQVRRLGGRALARRHDLARLERQEPALGPRTSRRRTRDWVKARRRLRGALELGRQRRDDGVPAHGPGRAEEPPRRRRPRGATPVAPRRHPARARRRSRRVDAVGGPLRRRHAPRRLAPRPPLRPGRRAGARGRAAGPRRRGGLRGRRAATRTRSSPSRPSRIPASVYRLDLATGKTRGLAAAEGRLRSRRLRDDAGLRDEQGRHEGPDLPRLEEGRRSATATSPALLTGYGGFNVAELPSFSVRRLAFVERGGVVRARDPARRLRVRRGVAPGRDARRTSRTSSTTSSRPASGSSRTRCAAPKQLAITGGSNGGLLVGAVLNQRPELFGAAVPGRRRHGHAPLPQVHDRLGLGGRVRLGGRRGAVQVALRVLAAPQHPEGGVVPADARHDRPTTTTASSRRTPSSSRRRSRRRRAAPRPS